jgi:hypothetical protein
VAEEPQKRLPFGWIVAAVALTFPLFLVFALLGMPGNGRAAWIFAIVMTLAVKVRWELSECTWFWVTIAVLVAVHAPLIVLLPWTSKWVPAASIYPLAVLDGIVILMVVQFVEKRMAPSQPAETKS